MTPARFDPDIALQCQERYRRGEWRAKIFRDLVIDEIKSASGSRNVLDIGCGHGFDDDEQLQDEVAEVAGKFIGIEPDQNMEISRRFACCYRVPLEHAAIERDSIDVAYAVMVLEHLRSPDHFFTAIHRVLRPGGVFWGFTVDRRHYFSAASSLLEILKMKELYFRFVRGRFAESRYENYPTFYRCNTPIRVRECTHGFSHVDIFGLSRPGDTEPCFPKLVAPIFRRLDRLIAWFDLPGTLLIARCQK
jgi:SAM-dependent methyltransferase